MSNNWKIYGNTVKNDPERCCYCGGKIDEYSRTVDHLIPMSRGGIRANKNKLHACGDCNKLKGDMTPDEFKRAVIAMLKLENRTHKARVGYLKKIKINLEKIISSKSSGGRAESL
jgi:5-methylcytosine-specific restriction endonuclease McrA